MPLYTPSVDAVQEFRVQQSNFSAEIGFSGATVVNVVTRSGTNNLHGSLYEFVRNEKFNANKFFNNMAGIGIPPMRWNQFGATIGGPIKKDRIFFFGDYQGTRERAMSTFRAGVPSAAMRAGNFAEICSAGFNASGMCNDPNGQLWDPYVSNWSNSAGRPFPYPVHPVQQHRELHQPRRPNNPLPQRPGNLIDPVGQKIMSFFPTPNLGVGTAGYNRYSDWIGSISNVHNTTSSIRRSTGASPTATSSAPRSPGAGTPVATELLRQRARSLQHRSTDWRTTSRRHQLQPHVQPDHPAGSLLGATRNYVDRPGVGGDYPNFNYISELGLPSYMSASGLSAAPSIYINSYASPGGNANIGGQGWGIMKYAREVYHLMGNVDHCRAGTTFGSAAKSVCTGSTSGKPAIPAA